MFNNLKSITYIKINNMLHGTINLSNMLRNCINLETFPDMKNCRNSTNFADFSMKIFNLEIEL